MFSLPDHWMWDSWIADDGENFHLFFLRASRALVVPVRRHKRASIGHAISSDLKSWTLLPDALVAADSPAWDDLATWTGCTVRDDDGTWWLFYTGVSRTDSGLVQRIGAATSTDLITFTRVGDQPLVSADPTWYETYDGQSWFDEAWRDPFVFKDPDDASWHMLITARARYGDASSRGVIGHATSSDLRTWQVQAPISSPDGFGQHEVPQVHQIEGRPYLVFSCWDDLITPERLAQAPAHRGGIWTVAGEPGGSLLGPWDISKATQFDHPRAYAGQLVQDRSGQWHLHAFLDGIGDDFSGDIMDPLPLAVLPDGLAIAH